MAEHASEKTLSPIQGAHIPSTEIVRRLQRTLTPARR